MLAGRDETGDVRHVDHQISADLVRDLGKGLEINDPRVGRSTSDDHFGTAAFGQTADGLVVDPSGLRVDPVGNAVIELPGEIGPASVRQMPAGGQIHPHHGVSGLAESQIYAEVGLRAAVSLDVGIGGGENLPGALDADPLGDVDELAAAVIPMPGISFGVFVGQNAPHGRHDFGADEVFRGDQLQVTLLAGQLQREDAGDLRILLRDDADVFLYHDITRFPNNNTRTIYTTA